MTSAYEQGSVPTIKVSHRLRIAREYAGLDQAGLAERSGISRAAISNAENDQGTPRRTTINAWALACGVPATWIMTGAIPFAGPDGGGTTASGANATKSSRCSSAGQRLARVPYFAFRELAAVS